jgi:hypothetical protein
MQELFFYTVLKIKWIYFAVVAVCAVVTFASIGKSHCLICKCWENSAQNLNEMPLTELITITCGLKISFQS